MADARCIRCGRVIPEGRHVCLRCGDYDDQQRFCPPKHARQTNGDRIRAMSNEELAQFLCQIGDCKTCPFCSIQCNIREWLEREVNST